MLRACGLLAITLVLTSMTSGTLPGPDTVQVAQDATGASLSAQDVTEKDGVTSQAPSSGGIPAALASGANREYRATLNCGFRRASTPEGSFDGANCSLALDYCATVGQEGVWFAIWSRAAGSDDAWVFEGTRCIGGDAPAGIEVPEVPSREQIESAFVRLPFATVSPVVQPVGGVTLVNLPTYYEARWSAEGVEPGEVSEAVQLLSWSVEFRPLLASYDYHFGDGQRSGLTRDPGGPYPNSTVRHQYRQAAESLSVEVHTRLGGQFRVGGGEWQDLTTVVDLPVASASLTVKEARARLYTP